MAVRSLKNSTLENFANYSSSMNAGYSFQDYELIESVFLAGAASSVTFNNLNQYATEYKHLQIRFAGSLSGTSWIGLLINETVNSPTLNYYARHELTGNGSSVSSAGGAYNVVLVGVHTTNIGAMVIDILDAYSSTKRKTVKTLSGVASSFIQLTSGIRADDITPVTTLTLRPDGGNFSATSRFSLYGIR